MSETTTEPEPDNEAQLVDPADFGPETIDGQRSEGTESSTPSDDSQPGDPELTADPEDEPSS
ncbi:MAG: hypothetical protein ABWX74_04055 [Aeromicrobium sp.]